MGNDQSSSSGHSKNPPAQQPYEPPYPGPSAQYQFVKTEVTMDRPLTLGSKEIVTSNVEEYYPVLAQMMDQGYRMITFYHIPGDFKMTGGLLSQAVKMPFQGIFARYPQAPEQTRYQLRVEKSVIKPKHKWSGFINFRQDADTDTTHLMQAIANNTQNGGRLVCIELTGQETTRYKLTNVPKPIKGVDLFFEVPMSGPAENYIYNVVNAPIHITYSGMRPDPTVHCDWSGILGQQLSQGYRLVEIFMDETQKNKQGFLTQESELNSQWFFEKPASRAYDPTPVYQGTVVEHKIKIKERTFAGKETTVNWENIIQDMGNRGWELACILETPEDRFSGLTTMYMKCLLFFQRRILQ